MLDLGAGYATALAPSWRLAVGGAVTLANAAYLPSFFGVNTTHAAASGYAGYRPGAGLRDARAKLALTYLFSRQTSLRPPACRSARCRAMPATARWCAKPPPPTA